MGCRSNNATPPAPAIAPGATGIDPAAVAAELGRRGVDPRIPRLVPGFDAPFFQAGLAGYSDAPMRIVARRHGCPFCVTEALLDRALLGGGHGFDKANLESIADNVPGGEEDHPLAGQIIGSEPDEMAAAAIKMIEQAARADRDYRMLAYGGARAPHETAARSAENGAPSPRPVTGNIREAMRARNEQPRPAPRTFAVIDVNLACPVKKIRNKARGGHWLSQPDGAIDILRAVRDAVPEQIPCTVKLRRGSDDSKEAERNFRRIFEAAYELGYAWATVHGRTVEQKYVGPSRWTFLRGLVRDYPDRLIFGSGDVWEARDIFRMIEYTGVHAVSVARGCIGNPWIFRQARDMLAGRPPAPPTIDEQRRVLEDHFRLAVAASGQHRAARMMRKFGIRFAAHHPQSEQVRQRMIAVNNLADWRAVLRDFYQPRDTDTTAHPPVAPAVPAAHTSPTAAASAPATRTP